MAGAAPPRTAPRSTSFASLALALALAACGGPPKRQTAAEWVSENTTILSQLQSWNPDELHQGIARFLKLGRDRGTEVVNYLLEDSGMQNVYNYERIELVLARILAEWKDSRAIRRLLPYMRGRDSGSLSIAKEGLIAFGDDARILEAVKELLDDSDVEVRRNAAEVVSEMKGQEAVDILGEHYRVEENLEVRGACVMGLLNPRSKGERKMEFILDALEDKDLGIRQLAWDAVALKEPPVPFDPAGEPAVRKRAVQELRKWAHVKPAGRAPLKVAGEDRSS